MMRSLVDNIMRERRATRLAGFFAFSWATHWKNSVLQAVIQVSFVTH
jgi:hypothetical protein